MAMTCRNAVRASTAALGGHADESQRLELEAHLASCPACGAEHEAALAVVRGLRLGETDVLPPAAREAVRRALDGRAPDGRRVERPRRWPLAVGAAFALAAAAAVCLLALRDRGYEVIGGDVALAPAAGPAGDDGPRVAFRSQQGGRLRLGDATIDLERATAIAWTAGPRRLDLDAGAVTVDVVHRPGQHLEVRTPRFTVEVVGTRFTVDADGVRCERGLVRVRRPDGRVVARLGAGEGWRLDDEPAVWPPSALPVDPADSGLGAARRALAQGDAPGARRLAAPLFHLGRDVAVEARVIVAESFLVEGRYADAIDGYRLVVRDFPATAEAESSAFAIAQLESEHGRAADARAALRAYVTRYPHGRFQPEAAARLRKLASRAW